MKKDAPKPQETAAPYKPTPADAQAFDAYMAARAKAAPRLKVVPTAEGAGTITMDHPNKALGQIALMKALGTTDNDFADWLLKQLFYVGSKGSSPDEDGANVTHASPNKTCTPTIVRKMGDVEGISIPATIVVLLGILILLRNVPAHEGPL